MEISRILAETDTQIRSLQEAKPTLPARPQNVASRNWRYIMKAADGMV